MNQNQSQALQVLERFYSSYKSGLNFSSSFELLIALILSVQSSDEEVNKITDKLFKKFDKPEDYLKTKEAKLRKEFKALPQYENKAKYVIEACEMLVDKYHGEVPMTIKELEKLPGVGRKTANVILADWFQLPAFPVDSHVCRVSSRLGWTKEKDNPIQVEDKLRKEITKTRWINCSHSMTNFGKAICKARNPKCDVCEIEEYCAWIKE